VIDNEVVKRPLLTGIACPITSETLDAKERREEAVSAPKTVRARREPM